VAVRRENSGEHGAELTRAMAVKERHAARLAAHPNVVGVGVGYELAGGRRTGRVCIRVYVRKKLPKASLPADAVLPDSIEGVPIDVIEDEFVLQQAPTVAIDDHRRRQLFMVGGISIGNLVAGGSGTLGISVFDNRTGRELILSNWHVLCRRADCQVGEAIIQPGQGGGDAGTSRDIVGRLVRWSLDNVDAAVAEPTGQRFLFKEVLEIGRVEASAQPSLGMRVRKSGRTTGLTEGTIADVSADINTPGYPSGTITFHSQIVVEGTTTVTDKGDSGSVFVDDDDRVVGLLYAGSGQRALANPIDAVLAALDIKLGPGMTVLDWPVIAAAL
jgi:hypothetical protein